MNPTLIVVIAAGAAALIALAGTWYAWRDYRSHPDRYGYRPGERQRQFTGPQRGITREPIHRWPFAPNSALSAGRASRRVRTP